MTGRVGWLDCGSGASGDMLLGALVGAGVPLDLLQGAVDSLRLPERVELRRSDVVRGGVAAVKVDVGYPAAAQVERTWPQIHSLLEGSALEPSVAERALAVFALLAQVEARAHRVDLDAVHFHEVGALDALADVVAGCAGLAALDLAALHSSPVALGGGTTRSMHGRLPVPAPAVVGVLELRGVPAYGGPGGVEQLTPTGAALLAVHVTAWGPMPALRVPASGTGAGSREVPERSNVLRLLVGEPVAPAPAAPAEEALLLETNVDDLDPRVWPGVLAALLTAGASDAWLTPILMKKGRPAHTLSVLAAPAAVEALVEVVVRETTTIGVRVHAVTKRPLPREERVVEVDGAQIRVKCASWGGTVVTVQPEWDDVAAAATRLGRPAREVLARAHAAARALRP